jgi:hypothetical protein
MTEIEKTVHIIPLGHEIDRALIPFDKTKADIVYILTNLKEGKSREDMGRQQHHFTENVRKKLEEKGIKVSCVSVDLFDLRDVMNAISKIIVKEKESNNSIFLNMSAAGRLTSVAATLVGMAHDVKVYYVQAEKYPDDENDRLKHGLSICSSGEITRLTNFQIVMPDPTGLEILLALSKTGKKARMTDLLEVLQTKKCEGFEESFPKTKLSDPERKIQSKQLMKLDKRILVKLEKDGFVKRAKDGRVVFISLTDSGKYATYISGKLG